jgi:hypothetical protein
MAPRFSSGEECKDYYEPDEEIPDGCPLDYSTVDLASYGAPDIGPANGTEPLWSGEQVQYQPGEWICPQSWSASFAAWIPKYSATAYFRLLLPVTLRRIVGFNEAGVPIAEFDVDPHEEFTSYDPPGVYAGRGGTLYGLCYTKLARTNGNRATIDGFIRYFGYTGTLYRRSTGGSGGGRGWIFRDLATGITTPSPALVGGSAGYAIDQWEDFELCTAGWELWENGHMKCNANGERVG